MSKNLVGISIIRMAFVVLLMSVPTSFAQSTNATILGTVTDASGAVIAQAAITVTNADTGISKASSTDTSGDYRIPELLPGQYSVRVAAKGFKSFVRNGLNLDARAITRVDAVLPVGSSESKVEVTGATPTITTESGTVSEQLQSESLKDLPLNYRATDTSPLNAVIVIPEIQVDTRFPSTFASIGISISGDHPGQNEVSVDGFSVTSNRWSGALFELFPSTESISEVKVTAQNASPEYGQLGDISFITRGGTNTYHGALFEYLQNDAFDATPLFATKKPPIRANDFGGAIGGPLRIPGYNGKDRTFFFFDWESNRFHTSSVLNQSVPTQAMRNGDFSALCSSYDANGTCTDPAGIKLVNPSTGRPYPQNQIPRDQLNPISQNILKTFYPLPNFANSNPANLAGNYNTVLPSPTEANLFDIRVDQKLSSKQTLWGRFNWKNITASTPLGLSEGDQADGVKIRSVGFSHTYTIRPSLLNEFRAGYNSQFTNISYPAFPNGQDLATNQLGLKLPGPFQPGSAMPGFSFLQSGVTATGLLTNLGGARAEEQHLHKLQLTDNFSWLRNHHLMKMGVDFKRVFMADFVSFTGGDNFGVFQFDGTISGYDVADFMLGLPKQSVLALAGPNFRMVGSDYGFYWQDQFQVTRKLTLNYGLRYELHPPYWDETLQLSNFDPRTPITGAVVVPNEAALKLAAPGFLAAINACPGYPGATTPCTPVITAAQDHIAKQLRYMDFSKVLPRLSFAYRPSDKWVIRGGAGFFAEQMLGEYWEANLGVANADVRAFQNSITNGVPAIQFPNTTLGGIGVVGQAGTEDFRAAEQIHMPNPYEIQWNLTTERTLGAKTGVRLTYTGLRADKLVVDEDINEVHPHTGPYDPSMKPFPNWRIIFSNDARATAIYNAFEAVVTRRFASGLSFQSSYTWSKNLSNAEGNADYRNLGFMGNDGRYEDNRFNLGAQYGNVTFSRKHRWLTTYTYNLPIGRGERFGYDLNPVLNAVLGNWQTTGVLLLQSGAFWTPEYYGGTDPSGTGANFKDPGQVPDRVCSGYLPHPTAAQYFNGACFPVPPTGIGRFGDSGVGILEGPGTVNFNAGLAKLFPITERVRFRFEATITNLLNHGNLGEPSMNAASPSSFGQVTSVQTVGGTGARNVQFGFRVDF